MQWSEQEQVGVDWDAENNERHKRGREDTNEIVLQQTELVCSCWCSSQWRLRSTALCTFGDEYLITLTLLSFNTDRATLATDTCSPPAPCCSEIEKKFWFVHLYREAFVSARPGCPACRAWLKHTPMMGSYKVFCVEIRRLQSIAGQKQCERILDYISCS